MANGTEKKRKTFHVSCTIKDGEYEYGDSLVMQCDGANVAEQAFRELAGYYACDPEEEQEIVNALQSEGEAMIGDRTITQVSIKEAVPITVIVHGGLVQDIRNIPEEVAIRIQDYDIDGLTAEELEKLERDEEGNSCVVSVWEPT